MWPSFLEGVGKKKGKEGMGKGHIGGYDVNLNAPRW
jgi:hypothetical protein